MKLELAILLATLVGPAFASSDFDRWADDLAAQQMRADPIAATTQQYFTGDEQARIDGKFAPITKAALLADAARERRALDKLRGFDLRRLTPVQRASAGVIAWSLEQDIAASKFLDDEYVFNQFNGLQVRLVSFMTQQQPLRNARDVRNYLERLSGLAMLVDQGIARARSAQAHGVLMPRLITLKAVKQLEAFLSPGPTHNVLVTALDERTAQIPDWSPQQRESARFQATNIVERSVLPAWRRALALMSAQLPQTNDDAGVWRFQHGDKFYAAQLRRMTSTNLTPQEVHAIGLSQVARLEGEMDSLLREQGYVSGTVKYRFAQMEAALQPKDGDPRTQLLARYTTILRDAECRSKLLFDVRPTAPVEVRREPELTETTAAAHYSEPAPDGSRPGVFWAPLPGPTFDIAEMRTLVYHEAVPGHHFQIASQQESQYLPRYRRARVFSAGSAFLEGWALYAEQLATDNGWYDGDPIGRLGQLQLALFRARRLVVDTGLHAMRWTRQQAIDYGIPPSEVDRYIVWPGQACAYMIGRLKIEALRDKAKSALGGAFDIKKFHNLVLLTGDVPLPVLEQVIDDWVKMQRDGEIARRVASRRRNAFASLAH